jgi:hypothetical protein
MGTCDCKDCHPTPEELAAFRKELEAAIGDAGTGSQLIVCPICQKAFHNDVVTWCACDPPTGVVRVYNHADWLLRVAELTPCRHCKAHLIQADDGDGIVEDGCCEGCPNLGSGITPKEWIVNNRKMPRRDD